MADDKIKGVTGIILAGGKGSRYNHLDKGTLDLNGKPLIRPAVDCFSKVFSTVLIVTNKPALYNFSGVRVVEDDEEYLGSLNGILCGLRASPTQWNFVAACDMPFVEEKVIRFLAEYDRDCDILVPEGERGPQPLFALYSQNCIPVMEDRVKRRLMKIQDIFPLLRTTMVPLAEIRKVISGPDPFFNINRPEDLQRARGMEG